MRILVVEDDLICRKLMLELLSSWGKCETVVNGREAVEAFVRALEGEQAYDLICLDIMMPEMDGKQALAQIRKMEAEKGIKEADRVKIVMTTAVQSPRAVMEFFHTGCEAYVVKPVTKAKLYTKLEKLGLISAENVGSTSQSMCQG